MNLFCFPYAGGSADIYKKWQENFTVGINIIPFEMQGKGRRITEPPYSSLEDAFIKIIDELEGSITYKPYALLGHSMGGIIVSRLVEEIELRELPMPSHIFISGAKPPHIKNSSDSTHLLPREEFIQVIKEYGGTPNEFFNNQELVDFFLPKLRNDFMLASTSNSKLKAFKTDLTIFYGESENGFSSEEANQWKLYTEGNFSIYSIPGTHFFINEHPSKVIKIINDTISLKVLI